MGVVFVLKDPVRSFRISTLDCWRIFGVFLFGKDFVFFFFFPIIFGIFKGSFFFFLGFLKKKKSVFSFPPRAGKQGIMGPGFI